MSPISDPGTRARTGCGSPAGRCSPGRVQVSSAPHFSQRPSCRRALESLAPPPACPGRRQSEPKADRKKAKEDELRSRRRRRCGARARSGAWPAGPLGLGFPVRQLRLGGSPRAVVGRLQPEVSQSIQKRPPHPLPAPTMFCRVKHKPAAAGRGDAGNGRGSRWGLEGARALKAKQKYPDPSPHLAPACPFLDSGSPSLQGPCSPPPQIG